MATEATPGTPPVIGIIGGSGIYEIEGLQNAEWRRMHSSFGKPSDAFLFGELDGQRLVFLPRHGRGHKIPPSELNFRAEIAVDLIVFRDRAEAREELTEPRSLR